MRPGLFWADYVGGAANLSSATLGGAIALAIGIDLQNFPEGAAVSLSLRRKGIERTKSFLMGQASGLVLNPLLGCSGQHLFFLCGASCPMHFALPLEQ
jgi:zinc transporter ZupT